jgi:predicted nucleic acid-binding Zn ribbon protein
MKRSKTESITNLLNEFLREQGLETPLNQHRLIEMWPEVMGNAINQQTNDLFIKNQTLYLKIKSAALKNDLMMNRAALVQRLNEAVGAYVITDIKIT